MNFSSAKRAIMLGEYIVNTGSTVRQAGKHFGISKSTVHSDITEKLPLYNALLYKEVRKVLDTNKNERHLRGGCATKIKYLSSKNNLK